MAELFIAIACEELPARYVEYSAVSLAKNIENLIKDIDHGAVTVYASPRRIAVCIENVATESPKEEKIITGPPADRAFVFHEDGSKTLTPAGIGFAKGKNIDPETLEIVDLGAKGKVVAVRTQTGGESTIQRIQQGISNAVLGIEFDRSMRWGSSSVSWARPIHRLIALFDGQIIPCAIGSVEAGLRIDAGNVDAGHRLFAKDFTVHTAEEWVENMKSQCVIVDRRQRQDVCIEQLESISKAHNAQIRDWDLVEEVVDLVEWPKTVICQFPVELLDLPPRLLVEAMKLHQRVFPLYDNDGKLLHTFLAVTNHPFADKSDVAATIAEGNKRVLTARFYDAKFFYAEDRKKTLEEHAVKLQSMRWVRNGGTMADKVQRLEGLCAKWSPVFGADTSKAERAAHLCKADLASQMVYEFTDLQGHVGRLLAQFAGEDSAVAMAIEEHYLPRNAEDTLPQTPEGKTVAFLDRMDTLQECFRLGLQPKGSSDPLGLRRAANGVISIVLDSQLSIRIQDIFTDSNLVEFVTARMKAQLEEEFGKEIVQAVLASGEEAPLGLHGRMHAMRELSNSANFGELRATFKRVMGLTKDHTATDYNPDGFVVDAEKQLCVAFQEVYQNTADAFKTNQFSLALHHLSTLKPAVDNLFDSVMVMDEDLAVRHNRLCLLKAIANEFRKIADFTMLSA